MSDDRDQITQLLAALSGGKRDVVDALMPLVYTELHAMAERRMARERGGHTLGATALVHEAYIRLIDQRNVSWQNRAHFFAIAAQAMRRILINYAERHVAQKRGGGQMMVTLDDDSVPRETRAEELIELDSALGRLAELSERQARVVEYRFFAGLKQEEIAEVLDVSVPTVRRDWRLARAWLSREMGD